MTNSALRKLTPDELRDEKIIQDVVKGCDIGQVAHAHSVTLEHIHGLFQPPRFVGSKVAVKALELARLDVATRAIMADVEAGDHNAIDRLLKIQARRSKYLGLDSPVQVEQQSEVVVTINWVGPDRLAYLRGEKVEDAVEVPPAAPAIEQRRDEPWREPKPDAESNVQTGDLLRDAKANLRGSN
ncbi:MAG: hypothetical protein JNL87_23035 [Burkholderiaceae bacterium]|nr:hypothetical protein [Burkholderiaceae bacterium]